GRVVASLPRAEASEVTLVPLMFDDPVREPAPRRPATSSRRVPALELRGVRMRAEAHGVGLTDVDLAVEPGEVVGVAGVSGNGQRELGDVILGAVPCAAGSKFLAGDDATRWPVARVRASGVAFVPDDALGLAAVPQLTVLENAALGSVRRYARAGGLAMDWPGARGDQARAFGQLG